jgi:RNA polymerase sigma factor (sigma-70 family)
MIFPQTRHSAVRGLNDDDAELRRQSYEIVVAAYWNPVHAYLRLRWNVPDEPAKDLTQSFFATAMEKETLTRYDPAKATFRTYLRACLDGFVLNTRKFENRVKRAGDTTALPLDFEIVGSGDPDELFHREWVRRVFELAIDEIRGRELPFQVFEAYDLAQEEPRPSYDVLAARFGITTATVTNYLAAMRRDLRKAVVAKLRELTATEREFRSEAKALLGIEPS